MLLKCKIMAIVFVFLFCSGCGAILVNRSHETYPAIEGAYGALAGGSSLLEIRVEGERYVILLSGGSSDAMGVAAPADCYLKAIGNLVGRTLEAEFASIETETFYYSKAQAEQERRKLRIVFETETAEVTSADTFGYCGLGISFLGQYKHKSPALL